MFTETETSVAGTRVQLGKACLTYLLEGKLYADDLTLLSNLLGHHDFLEQQAFDCS